MTLADILPVCPGSTEETKHTLIEVTPNSNRLFCRHPSCNFGYLIIDPNGNKIETWMKKE